MPGKHRAAGWTLAELIAVVAALTLLAAAVIVSTRDARRQASLGDNLANLKQYASAFAGYAADCADRVGTFSWGHSVDYGFGGVATFDYQAAANQAVHILRTRAGRDDIDPIPYWIPYLQFSHLVLAEYLDHELPARYAVAPEDRLRLLWQADPLNFESLDPSQRPTGEANAIKRWPYSSSYELAPAFMAADGYDYPLATMEQGHLSHSSFAVPDPPSRMGRRKLTTVSFPSHKAMMYEQVQRHFGPTHIFFSHPRSLIPMLLVDGHARVVRTASANFGFEPNNPTSPAITRINYVPEPWEPPPVIPGVLDPGRYRWTRSGLYGRDFSGPEIRW